MLYPSMKTLLSEIGNRYLLVNVVARRAREIAEEAEERGEPLDDKPVTLAIEEIADGQLTIQPKQQAADVTEEITEESDDQDFMTEGEGATEETEKW